MTSTAISLASKIITRIPRQVRLPGVVAAAWLLAYLANIHNLQHSPEYSYATNLLLGLGLYGSTTTIDLTMARSQMRLIIAATTIGVLCKVLLIGGAFYVITRNPVSWLIAIVVAQIDPLAVAAIINDKRMTAKAKTLLAAWASFDDPITVILAVYASAVSTGTLGLRLGHTGQAGWVAGIGRYGADLGLNLLCALAAYLAWRYLRRWPRLQTLALVAVISLALWQFLMLAIAITGLFVRPAWLEARIRPIIGWALLAAGVLLGMLLPGGISLTEGVVLGFATYASQVAVSLPLTRKMRRTDRIHLALAQQNGITAIILALQIEVTHPGTVAIVAPAIVTINLIYYATNRLADSKTAYTPEVEG